MAVRKATPEPPLGGVGFGGGWFYGTPSGAEGTRTENGLFKVIWLGRQALGSNPPGGGRHPITQGTSPPGLAKRSLVRTKLWETRILGENMGKHEEKLWDNWGNFPEFLFPVSLPNETAVGSQNGRGGGGLLPLCPPSPGPGAGACRLSSPRPACCLAAYSRVPHEAAHEAGLPLSHNTHTHARAHAHKHNTHKQIFPPIHPPTH